MNMGPDERNRGRLDVAHIDYRYRDLLEEALDRLHAKFGHQVSLVGCLERECRELRKLTMLATTVWVDR